MKKKIVGFLLAFTLLIGAVNPVYAINNDATLNASENIVTTTYNNCYASTVVYVYGYEINPSTQEYQYYNKSKSTTNTGAYTFRHTADNGRKFVLSYNGHNLTSQVVVGGTISMTKLVHRE